MRYSIGIDISRTMIEYGLFDEEKRLVSRKSAEPDPSLSPEEFFDGIVRCVRSFMEERVITNDNINGIGIALPSIVLPGEGRVISSFGFPKLRDFNAIEYLVGKLGDVKIAIDTSACTQALAEHRFGAGRGHQKMIYCLLGTEISASAIMDNQTHPGADGVSGLFGHFIASLDECFECECGNSGCVSSWVSGEMIVNHVKKWIDTGEPSLIDQIAGGKDFITTAHISTAYERGDALAERAVKQMAKYIGTWLYNMYIMLGIDLFVLNGSLLQMGKKLTGPIRKTFDTCNTTHRRVEFANSQIRKDLGITGAIELLYDYTQE